MCMYYTHIHKLPPDIQVALFLHFGLPNEVFPSPHYIKSSHLSDNFSHFIFITLVTITFSLADIFS